jgi:hypothetical protein
MIKQRNDVERAKALDRLPELTEDEASRVTGGDGCNDYVIYYDVEKKEYIAVRQGQVFYRPGTILVC